MQKHMVLAMVLSILVVLPAVAQRPEGGQHSGETRRSDEQQRGQEQRPVEPGYGGPRANQGRIPPPPPQRPPNAKPDTDRRDGGRVNSTPHVADNHWYGHDRPDDRRYRLDHPLEHGRFERFGPAYRYTIARIDRDHRRFWLPGGYWFEVPGWDWPVAEDWCWNCGEDFVVYEDPDHPGWYLLYNVHTGTYVHVLYMGT